VIGCLEKRVYSANSSSRAYFFLTPTFTKVLPISIAPVTIPLTVEIILFEFLALLKVSSLYKFMMYVKIRLFLSYSKKLING
jgi:hypothetical protein